MPQTVHAQDEIKEFRSHAGEHRRVEMAGRNIRRADFLQRAGHLRLARGLFIPGSGRGGQTSRPRRRLALRQSQQRRGILRVPGEGGTKHFARVNVVFDDEVGVGHVTLARYERGRTSRRALASELGPLSPLDQQFCEVISLSNLGRFTRRYDWCRNGAPNRAGEGADKVFQRIYEKPI